MAAGITRREGFEDVVADLKRVLQDKGLARTLSRRLKVVAKDMEESARRIAPVGTYPNPEQPHGYTRDHVFSDIRGIRSGDIRLRLRGLSNGAFFHERGWRSPSGARGHPSKFLSRTFERIAPRVAEEFLRIIDEAVLGEATRG